MDHKEGRIFHRCFPTVLIPKVGIAARCKREVRPVHPIRTYLCAIVWTSDSDYRAQFPGTLSHGRACYFHTSRHIVYRIRSARYLYRHDLVATGSPIEGTRQPDASFTQVWYTIRSRGRIRWPHGQIAQQTQRAKKWSRPNQKADRPRDPPHADRIAASRARRPAELAELEFGVAIAKADVQRPLDERKHCDRVLPLECTAKLTVELEKCVASRHRDAPTLMTHGRSHSELP